MKRKLFSLMAVIMTVILIFETISASAALSYERVNKDYRNMDILNRNNVKINKPTSQFVANRVVNGSVADVAISYADYDCTTEFPTLVCYVGDTLTFNDLSKDNNGGSIIEWDWQYYGDLENSNNVYKSNIVNSTSFNLTEPGETIFYLCVKGNGQVKRGCCDLWSENGNHQVVGKNKWFPAGAYWYFTAIRVIVKPVREAIVHVRYWDAQNNKVFHEGTVNAGKILSDAETVDASVHITDWEGYKYSGWNVQLMDGTIQYNGTERDVGITLAGWVPEKYLNVEFFPYADTSVEVRYWDKLDNFLISSQVIPGERVLKEQESNISATLKAPAGYKMNGWNVQLTDGTIQYEGQNNPVMVTLNGYYPKKYLNVKCFPINDKKLTVNYIDSESGNLIDSDIIVPEGGGQDKTVSVEFKTIKDYIPERWELKLSNNTIIETGTESPVDVILTNSEPRKILDVICLKLDEKDDKPLPPPTVIVKPSGVCDGVITWTETDSHRVKTGKNSYRTCTHTFKYKTILTATGTITPSTLKSGYGFGVDVDCSLSTTMISNSGCGSWGNGRAHTATVKNPTKATVFVPWDMENRLGSQGKSISLEPNGNLKFTTAVSRVSEMGARKIYTPVTLAGTKEHPETHSFEIYVNGGGVGSVEFCQKMVKSITIIGDMYEDDFSGAD